MTTVTGHDIFWQKVRLRGQGYYGLRRSGTTYTVTDKFMATRI